MRVNMGIRGGYTRMNMGVRGGYTRMNMGVRGGYTRMNMGVRMRVYMAVKVYKGVASYMGAQGVDLDE